MHEPAIEVSGVWKSFRRGERYDSLRELLPGLVSRFLRREVPSGLAPNRFWAVEDVSFKVNPGEALGIIGPNGGGKSTLLKLLTRVLRPTRGAVLTRGRVGALIEVGAAFHPDLTGRENVFLQGAIYGMSTREIARRLGAIVDFAGVGDFLDTPVKRYSSGMQARLGFSVAAHLEPDVLLIDEVLAVGDAAFQARCVERMKRFKDSGTAIIFVSHNLQAVSDLCDRTIYLRRSIQAEGPSDDVIATYLSSVRGGMSTPRDDMPVDSVCLLDQDGNEATAIRPGSRLCLRLVLRPTIEYRDPTFVFHVYRSTDSYLVSSRGFRGSDIGMPSLPPGSRATLEFDFGAHLVAGQYHISFGLLDNKSTRPTAWLAPAAVFRVEDRHVVGGVAHLGVDARVVMP